MYQGNALATQSVLDAFGEKAKGAADAKKQLAEVSAIADEKQRDEKLDVLLHDLDDAADLGKVSLSYRRGWLTQYDEWCAEQNTRMDGEDMMPTEGLSQWQELGWRNPYDC